MDILKPLNNVTSLDEYIAATQDVVKQSKNVKVQINITTVLTLKKIRSFEIQYLNKCDKTGIACIILEHLLALPPSKAWGSGLGKELICLIEYWLVGIRKHLLNRGQQWWIFLKQLLIFIKDIRPKAPSMPNLLVEHLTESLLDTATSDLPDAFQRYEIMHALNMCCAESSREIRFALRNKFADHFVKLASQMATSGYLPYQYSALECLVRWLVPRQERWLRAAAAAKWFPPDLYPNTAVQIFKQTSWANFYQDARNFLNELNFANGLVTSVVCRRLSVGDTVIVSGSEKEPSWLDLNSVGPSASVLLDPRALVPFGVRDFTAAFALCVTEDITLAVQLHSESGVTLSLTTDKPPSVRPSGITLGDEKNITVSLSSRTDLRKMHQALKRVFGDKYQLLMNLNSQMSLSPPRSIQKGKSGSYSEEDTRFSHPVEVKRKRHIGDAVRSRLPKGVSTPSSASGSSVAQLQEKLAALPLSKYDKEWGSVCAQPALSRVSELSERDERTKSYGVAQNDRLYSKIKSEFDSETKSHRETLKSQSDTETTKTRRCRKHMFPVVSDNEVSVLLAASTDSIDDATINETVERLSKKKGSDFDRRGIVDLLIQEALQERERATDSGINTDDNKRSQDTEENSEAIEETPVLINESVMKSKTAKKKVCTVVSKSTTDDESNTEVVNETPFVNSRNRSKHNAAPNSNSNTFDVNLVENFFSQHYTANKEGDDNIVINPTTAKKTNVEYNKSSESSDHFDECLIMNENFNPDEEIFQFNDIDIIECLNDVVDKVCHEIDKCSEYLRDKTSNKNCPDNLPTTPKRSTKSTVVRKSKTSKTKAQSKPKREIKIKLKTSPEKKKSKRVFAKKIKKTEQKSPNKMSTITEQSDEGEAFVENEVREVIKVQTPKVIEKDRNVIDKAPIVRQKRKLYSPKDNDIEIEKISKIPTSETDEADAPLSDLQTKDTTPKSTVSCYKEIENERKKRIRSKPRISKGKVQEPPSPRTLKNNETFDKMKETVEGSERIVLIDRTNYNDKPTTRKNKQIKEIEVYNFTSDSEDEDFIKKKIEVRKKISSTTISSSNSKASNRRGRKKNPVNYLEWKSSDDEAKQLPVKRKPPAKRATKQKAVAAQHVIDMVDEKIREATDTMNTSLVIESKPEKKESPNIELILNELPEMEPISDTEEPKQKVAKTFPKRTNKKPEIVSIKTEKNKKVNLQPASDKEDSKSVASTSPLPGLVVEPIPSRKDDADDSITANMALKFKKIYQDGPDQNESNITQNMLSDIERNNSQQNKGLSVTDEIRAEYDNIREVEETNKPIKIREKSEPRKSNPIKEFDDEIVQVSKENNKSSNIKKPTKTKVIDGLRKTSQLKEFAEEIIEISEDKISHDSPMSIASYGINAHNDLEAAPPSPDTLQQYVRPREIEDLDQPMREYYEKLSKEINKTHDDSKEKSIPEVQNKSVNKSAAMTVQRLVIDDIGKYLPSPKSSITSSGRTPVVAVQRMSLDDIHKYQSQRSSNSGTQSPIRKRAQDNTGKYLPSPRSSEPENFKVKPKDTRKKVKSPIANIARISLEEFDEWLPPMPKITEYKPSPKKRKIIDPDYEPSSRKSKGNLRLIFESNEDKEKSNRRSYSSETSTRILRERPPNTSEEDTNEQPLTRNLARKLNASNTTPTSVDVLNKIESNTTRKSNIISPVKSFAEFVTNLKQSTESEGKSLTKIRTFTKSASKMTDSKITDHSDEEITQIKTFAKPKTPKFKDTVPAARKIPMERASSPLQVSERELKKPKHKQLTISERVPSKRYKYDDVVTISESGPSAQSVQDWFKRTEASTKGNISESSEDAIKYILEKLDTTLSELDHNTNKKFVNLFVGAQSQLTQQKEDRRKMYQDTLNDLMEYIENKFVDLNRRSRDMDTEFMDSLKERAFELLKQDCKQKRAMIVLLKEDVQSVLDHIGKDRSRDS